MKLRLIERKRKLTEADESSELEVSMTPASYIKLTTEYADFNSIMQFMSDRLYETAKEIDTFKQRKSFVEKKLGGNKTPLAAQLILGALNFLKPTVDVKMWGSYDPEKTGATSLAVEIINSVGKVKNHEGRNRSLYLWMTGQTKINVSIFFTNAIVNTVEQMPQTIISQFDDKSKVFRNDISPAVEKDKSKFRTIEGFLNNLGPFPKQSEIDDINKKTIKVGNKDVVLVKAVAVSKRPDGTYSTSVYKAGLYDKEVLNIPRTNNIEYWVEVDKHKLSSEQGPVTIS